MPPITLPNLGLESEWAVRESGWKPGMELNLRLLDRFAQLSVKSQSLSAPPGGPASGDTYIVGPSPTGAWSGHAKAIAVYETILGVSGWTFYAPRKGYLAWLENELLLYVYDGTNWTVYRATIGGTARKLWLPANLFSDPILESSPQDDKAYSYINMPQPGTTHISTTWQVPNDFGSLSGFDVYLVSTGTSSTNLTLWWAYIQLDPDGNLVENGPGLAVATLTVSPSSSGRLVIRNLTLPTGPPTLTAGSVAKMVIERDDAGDANPDAYRFLGVLMRYLTA